MIKNNLALYFHYPFCLKKCNYCDFTSIIGSSDERLANAYLNCFNQHKEILDQSNITTLFFGGGTPSLISETLLETLLSKLDLSRCVEFSIEVNPATVDENKINFLKDVGVNRISIGVQALNDKDLKVLGRLHSTKQAMETIEIAKKYFNNVSADFIYGRPNQTAKDWEQELQNILSIDLDHISMYQLTIENGWNIELPNDNETEKMFILNHENTKSYIHYEISNYAKNEKECLHNLAYWRYQNYLGIGAGAHSRINGKAMTYQDDVKAWLDAQILNIETLNEKEILTEKLLMGLRLSEGVELNSNDFVYIEKTTLAEFIEQGLLKLDNKRLIPSFKGMQLNNYIIEKILKDPMI